MPRRDWDAEIDRWTERFRTAADPPEPFATALREGWTADARAALAREAESYRLSHEALLEQIRAAGVRPGAARLQGRLVRRLRQVLRLGLHAVGGDA